MFPVIKCEQVQGHPLNRQLTVINRNVINKEESVYFSLVGLVSID